MSEKSHGKKELVEVVWQPGNAALTQHTTVCCWASTSTLFPVCSFCKIEVTAQQNDAWIWSMNSDNSVYRNVCSFSCYRSLLLFSGFHLFLPDAVHTITILITKIIAACITLLLFDNIWLLRNCSLKLLNDQCGNFWSTFTCELIRIDLKKNKERNSLMFS